MTIYQTNAHLTQMGLKWEEGDDIEIALARLAHYRMNLLSDTNQPASETAEEVLSEAFGQGFALQIQDKETFLKQIQAEEFTRFPDEFIGMVSIHYAFLNTELMVYWEMKSVNEYIEQTGTRNSRFIDSLMPGYKLKQKFHKEQSEKLLKRAINEELEKLSKAIKKSELKNILETQTAQLLLSDYRKYKQDNYKGVLRMMQAEINQQFGENKGEI